MRSCLIVGQYPTLVPRFGLFGSRVGLVGLRAVRAVVKAIHINLVLQALVVHVYIALGTVLAGLLMLLIVLVMMMVLILMLLSESALPPRVFFHLLLQTMRCDLC